MHWCNNRSQTIFRPNTSLMSFWQLKSPFPHREVIYPRIKINSSSVEVVDEFKFLGIFIDKHLKWSTHTEFIANKISKYTGVINRLKHTLSP